MIQHDKCKKVIRENSVGAMVSMITMLGSTFDGLHALGDIAKDIRENILIPFCDSNNVTFVSNSYSGPLFIDANADEVCFSKDTLIVQVVNAEIIINRGQKFGSLLGDYTPQEKKTDRFQGIRNELSDEYETLKNGFAGSYKTLPVTDDLSKHELLGLVSILTKQISSLRGMGYV